MSRRKSKKIIVRRLSDEERQELLIPDRPVVQGPWSVWECGPAAFPWVYDQAEQCYLYEGEVKILTDSEEVPLTAGDYVTFPEGLRCRWEVHQTARKVYKLG